MAEREAGTDKGCRDKSIKGFRRTEEEMQIRPAAYRDLLRNRDFMHLWVGQMVSAIGDWINVAVLLALVKDLSGGKSWAISVMMLVKFLPAVMLGFMAGIIIDRTDRKRTLIICDLSRAGLVILFAFSQTLLMVLVLVFIIETFAIIYGPAKDASIPDLVGPDELAIATSLNQLTLFASMAFGTAIAGSVTGLIRWLQGSTTLFSQVDPNRATFFVDSLTFLIAAFLVSRIAGFKRRSEEERVKMSAAQVKEDFKAGLKYLWNQRLTRVVLILTLSCFLGGGTIYVLTIGFVNYVLGKGDSTFMYILSVLLFGIMTGSILGGVLRNRVRKERLMGLAISCFGTGVVVFSLLSVVWLSFIIAFLGGMCMGYAIVGMLTLLMETLDEEYRGRAFSAIQVIMRASIFLSIMLAGPFADLITGLGRRLGFDSISLGIIRFGGSFVGEIDGAEVDFTYLINGPQIILFLGGMVILIAGMFGHRSFHRYFGWTIHDRIILRKPKAAGETAWEPGGEEACGGETPADESVRVPGAVEEEMGYVQEAEQALKRELTGKPADGPLLREKEETAEAEGGSRGGKEDEAG